MTAPEASPSFTQSGGKASFITLVAPYPLQIALPAELTDAPIAPIASTTDGTHMGYLNRAPFRPPHDEVLEYIEEVTELPNLE